MDEVQAVPEPTEILSKAQVQVIREIRSRIVITKIVATRSVKGARGDTFAGFSSAFKSTQEDGGQGLENTGGPEMDGASSALSMRDARIAMCLLGMEADLAAHTNARANGNLPERVATDTIKSIKANYARTLATLLKDSK